MSELLSGLNPEQKKAAEQLMGPVLVLAGAGSGKTRTLTYRTANLIKKGINPDNILTLTFTNKAANNMKQKISELIGSEKANKIWMGTFHSIGLRILKSNLKSIGYHGDVSIYDGSDSEKLLKSIISNPRLEISKKEYPPQRMYYIISEMKNELIMPDGTRDFMKKNYSEAVYDPKRVEQIYQKYEELKRKYNAFDFGDLILKPVYLFKYNPKILKFYQKKFQFVQIDEYQDSNTAQYVFSKMLSEPQNNIMVVGDDDQAIVRP
jgi:DNA helicase-2/ATP-dependent DNA helicase PcrA